MIQLDWSQTVVAAAFAFGSDFDKGKDTKKMVDILRHTILTTILSHKKKFGQTYGDILLACDGRHYWRKEIFPQYKGLRKAGREESKTDWNTIFDISSQIREEIRETFPYKVVRTERAEADDVIAVLTKWLQTNELKSSMLDETPQDILIVSNDGDFKQLHKYKGVKQWNPLLKKFVTKAEKHFLLEKLLTGDAGDGIPNIRSYDNQLIEGVRQPPITAAIKKKAIAQVEASKMIYFGDKVMDAGFVRNRQLIDFDFIPEGVTNEIIESYLNNSVVRDKGKIFNYLIKNRCKLLMERIQDF
jgi:hypothetical protein